MSNASSVVYMSVNDGSIRYRLVKHFCNVVSVLCPTLTKKAKNGFAFHGAAAGSDFAFRERINNVSPSSHPALLINYPKRETNGPLKVHILPPRNGQEVQDRLEKKVEKSNIPKIMKFGVL